jgi:hypothetical protein
MTSSRNKPPAATLPDIDDALFKARLKPLADSVLPRVGPALQGSQIAVTTQGEPSRVPAPTIAEATRLDLRIGNSDTPEIRNTGNIDYQRSPFAAVHIVEQTRAARGPRRGVEFLLPERVVAALRAAAAERGVSLSVKLLEILRNAGYPVIEEDFVDIRKLPKR